MDSINSKNKFSDWIHSNEIEKDFISLSEVSSEDTTDIGYVFQVFGNDRNRTSNTKKGFSFCKKPLGRAWNMFRENIVIEVIKDLMNDENPYDLCKKYKMSIATIVRIIRNFTKELEDRGLVNPLNMDVIAPLGLTETAVKRPWRRPNVRLNEYEVSIIRGMLDFGISMRQCANLFSVSPSTISQIRDYMTWKNVKPKRITNI